MERTQRRHIWTRGISMKQIETEDGLLHEFPDGATDSAISASLAAYYKKESSNLLSDANGLVNDFAKFAFNAPLEATKDLPNAGRDIAQGLLTTWANLGQTIGNAPSKLMGGKPEEIDFEEFFSPIGSGRKGIGAELLRGFGKYGTAGALSGPRLAAQALGAAATGYSNAKEGRENLFGLLPSGKFGAAIEDLVGTAGVGTAFKLLEKGRPANVLRGTLSDDELLENAATASGTDTSLGKVIGNEWLHRQLANVLSKLPFSGAGAKLESAGKQVNARGESIVSDILGGNDIEEISNALNKDSIDALKQSLGAEDIYAADEVNQTEAKEIFNKMRGEIPPEDVEPRISEILTTAAKEQEQLSKKSYNNVSNLADEDSNFELRAPEFAKLAKDDDVKKFLAGDEELLETYDNLIKLEKKESPAPHSDIYGGGKPPEKKPKSVSLSQANILKAKLNRLGNDAARSADMSDRHLAGKFKKIAAALGDGIDRSVEKSGNVKLKEEFKQAQKNYGENYAPHLDTDVYKYQNRIGSKTDVQGIAADIIKTGKSDKSNRVNKITKKLGKESGLLSYSYFKPAINADGSVDLKKVGSLMGSLGNEQLKELIPNASDRKALSDLIAKQDTFSYFSPAIKADGSVDFKTLSSLYERASKDKSKINRLLPDAKHRDKFEEIVDKNNRLEAFKPAMQDGSINNAKLATVIGKLAKDPAKLKEIAPKKEQREALSQYSKLQKLNENSASSLANTPTGQKVMDLIPYILAHVAGAAAGGGGGFLSAGGIGAIPGAIAGFAAPGIALKPITNRLTSTEFRNNLIGEMLANRTKIDTNQNRKSAQLLLESVIEALRDKSRGEG